MYKSLRNSSEGQFARRSNLSLSRDRLILGAHVRVFPYNLDGEPLPMANRHGTIVAALPDGSYDVWFYGQVIERFEAWQLYVLE